MDVVFRWSTSASKALISAVSDNYIALSSSSSVKKRVWSKVSKSMELSGFRVNGQQCDTKWKALKLKYKDVLQKRGQSGHGSESWDYFDDIHAFMYNRPEVNPVSKCSSFSGFKRTSTDDATTASTSSSSSSLDTPKKPKKDKREAESAVERRHQENLDRKDQFLECFRSLVDTLKKAN